MPDYARAPLLVIWEVTRACDLACAHCRAEAQPDPDPAELTHAEGIALLDGIHEMGTRLVVFTGGDPAKRHDLVELVRAARARGLIPSISPSATPLLTPELVGELARAGAASISLSLDGSGREVHDDFRGIPGTYDRTLRLASEIVQRGVELRINTTVNRRNLDDLDALAAMVERLGTSVWSVFFLVPIGRASEDDQITPDECEESLRWLYHLSRRVPFRIKTTAAPHYRRVVLEEEAKAAGGSVRDLLARGGSMGGRYAPGLNDGRGFCFVSHTGEVFPSGFLPVEGGNVRQAPIASIYRDSKVFRSLRDTEALAGRCGDCALASLCGGSRARAFAVTGDLLAQDPLCERPLAPAKSPV